MTCDCNIKTEAEASDILYKCNRCNRIGWVTKEEHKMTIGLVKYKILEKAIDEIATFPQTMGDDTWDIVATMRQIALEAMDDIKALSE